KNLPIDQRNFASQNTSFGTGAVDFSPDGSRLFCLDTGNGIIAFSMAPRLAAPSICYPPQNFIAPLGNVGFFGVDVIGGPLNYRWRFNGTNIPAATNRTLDTYYIAQTNLGRYTVVITNSLGSVTSSVAILDTPMAFSNQPSSQIVAIGGTATFTAGVTNGLPAYSNQWFFNGSSISGATTNPFVINNAQVANAGAYTVAITDSLGQSVTSSVAVLTVGTVGTGDGLRGDYYNLLTFTGNPPNPFSGSPAFSRVDPTVNFDFGIGSPDPSVQVDYFTARWSGQVQPFYSQSYNFYSTSDDGSRVWVNGLLVVTNWVTQGPTERSGPPIALTANQKYEIVMEYYEQTGGATARLSWSSTNQTKGIIPQSQLYSAASSPVHPVLSLKRTDATHVTFSWNGSYVLQSATDLNGPWTTISGATSPYTIAIDPASPQPFFRLPSQ